MIRAVLSRCGLTGIFSSGNREEIRSQKCVDKKSWQIVVKRFIGLAAKKTAVFNALWCGSRRCAKH
jgi:hypothetical protein